MTTIEITPWLRDLTGRADRAISRLRTEVSDVRLAVRLGPTRVVFLTRDCCHWSIEADCEDPDDLLPLGSAYVTLHTVADNRMRCGLLSAE